MEDKTTEEKRLQLEAKQWLYQNRELAGKMVDEVTAQLTASGEFFSQKQLGRTLADTAENMTPENTGLSAEEIAKVSSLDAKKKQAVFSVLAQTACQSLPSVKNKEGETVYTTPEIVKAEQDILKYAEEMSKKSTEGQPYSNVDDIRPVVDQLAMVRADGTNGVFTLPQEYLNIFDNFLQPSFLQIANGPPGCGKSALGEGLLFCLTKAAIENGTPVPNFYATAPTDKAASDIVEDSNVIIERSEAVLNKEHPDERIDLDALKAVTSNMPKVQGGKKLDDMFEDFEQMQKGDVLIVDEAGLLGAKQMAKLLKTAHDKQIRLFMLGDNLQIPPAMAGNGFDELLMKKEELNLQSTELKVVLRQKDEIEAGWTLDIRYGDPSYEGDAEKDSTLKALKGYAGRFYDGFKLNEEGQLRASYTDVPVDEKGNPDKSKIPEGATPGLQFIDDVQSCLVADYIKYRTENPKRNAVVMATDEAEAAKLGETLRQAMIENGLIRDMHNIATSKGNVELGVGDLVMLNQGMKGVEGVKKGKTVSEDVKPGDQLEVVGFDDEKKTVTFMKGKVQITYDAEKFAEQSRNGVVLPLREAQGQSKDRAFLAVTKAGNMDKVYSGVAFSRHEQQMSAYVSNQAYPNGIEDLAKEMRVFSSRQQLYSDGKTVQEVKEAKMPEKGLQDRLNDFGKDSAIQQSVMHKLRGRKGR